LGTVGQNGRQLIIVGRPSWSTIGQINKDSTISLNWVQLSADIPTPGHYHWTLEGTLEGECGFTDEVGVEPEGRLGGETRGDVIRWIKML